jgi:ferrochelatase
MADTAPPRHRVGVLLVNLGTPEGTDHWSMRRYLKEFLTVRPGRKGRDYAKIWNRAGDESPLRTITRAQAEKLAAALADAGGAVVVDWAMRYGIPSIPARLDALVAAGCERILLVPLYPQYAAATTATVADKAFDALKSMRRQPALRVAPPYCDDPVYIDAVAQSLEASLARLDFKPEVILASFHGMPEDYVKKGDPYRDHCVETVRLLRARLGFDEERLRLTFQSRFGTAEWLKPYTDETVKALARAGVKNLAVVTPGFAADCLETLEEIAGENAGYFRAEGGENFAAIPCLNDSAEGMRVIAHLVRREPMGWL